MGILDTLKAFPIERESPCFVQTVRLLRMLKQLGKDDYSPLSSRVFSSAMYSLAPAGFKAGQGIFSADAAVRVDRLVSIFGFRKLVVGKKLHAANLILKLVYDKIAQRPDILRRVGMAGDERDADDDVLSGSAKPF